MPLLLKLLLVFASAIPLAAAAAPRAAWGDGSPATVEYLLDSAASDFTRHGPDPAAFRKVRFGTIAPEGERALFVVCGEVRPATGPDAGDWIEFATVRTEGYEQWLGSQGGGYCVREGTTWQPGDLSSELQRRVDALRAKR